ncbi:MAG: biotin/lipoyl-binding protein [Planctomycetota bacterium]|jgi:3-methylcrotonyl-CoA carboxylase alpha subunit/acetyl-CoA/propionyl-CoA carboxylase biotin carboxyl carrier protein|nr:biotin/lipoyl-binding protein [Planctomycetota bacterium]
MSRSQLDGIEPSQPPLQWKVIEWIPPLLTLEVEGVVRSVVLSGSTHKAQVGWRGQSFSIGTSRIESKRSEPSASGDLSAPMPGTVIEVKVSVGEQVSAGQVLMVLEAMKMEMAIRSPRDGSIRSISVTRGDPVVAGSMLVELDPPQEPE